MNGTLVCEDIVTISSTEYGNLINSWKCGKLRESFIMDTVEMADAYCSFLENNRNHEDFAKYQSHINQEIRAYKTTDEEIYSSIQAMIPTIDIS